MIRARGPLATRTLVTVLVLAWLGSRLDPAGVVEAVARIDGAVWALLALVTAADRALATARWLLLVRASGFDLPVRSGARLFLVSSFLGSFLPAGVGGDIARTWELATRTGRPGRAVAVAAVDRWLGLASVLALGAAGLVLVDGLPIDPRLAGAVHVLLGAVLLAGLAGRLAERTAAAVLPARWAAAAAAVIGAVREFLGRRAAVGLVVGLSFAAQVVRVLLAWLIGVGLAIDIPLSYYFVVMPIGIVLILLPISVAGLGPAQGAVMWMLRPAGVPDELSFAMSTLFVLLGVAGNLPGAVLFLRSRPRAQ